jgi:hypothetical protein
VLPLARALRLFSGGNQTHGCVKTQEMAHLISLCWISDHRENESAS